MGDYSLLIIISHSQICGILGRKGHKMVRALESSPPVVVQSLICLESQTLGLTPVADPASGSFHDHRRS